MSRRAGILLICLSFALLPLAGFAYSSGICITGDTCTEKQVGKFMKDISSECGNLGNCSLGDILIVFGNVANFALGLVGSLVLLMYVIGGFYMLVSHGDSGKVKKGKEFIKISTMGLLIVLLGWVGIEFLLRTLTDSNVQITVECIGAPDATACGSLSQCLNGACVDNATIEELKKKEAEAEAAQAEFEKSIMSSEENMSGEPFVEQGTSQHPCQKKSTNTLTYNCTTIGGYDSAELNEWVKENKCLADELICSDADEALCCNQNY